MTTCRGPDHTFFSSQLGLPNMTHRDGGVLGLYFTVADYFVAHGVPAPRGSDSGPKAHYKF